MQDQLIELQRALGKTIIFISHDLNEAMRLGDRIAIMRDGRIAGTATEISPTPPTATSPTSSPMSTDPRPRRPRHHDRRIAGRCRVGRCRVPTADGRPTDTRVCDIFGVSRDTGGLSRLSTTARRSDHRPGGAGGVVTRRRQWWCGHRRASVPPVTRRWADR